jgi:hypothetical protein
VKSRAAAADTRSPTQSQLLWILHRRFVTDWNRPDAQR